MRLTDEVHDILSRSVVAGNRLCLPGPLDRATYVRVAKAIELMGGKWDKKARAHVFEDPAEEVVADAVATGSIVDFRKEFQFFETPPQIARRLVSMADIRPGLSVLEPSAGKGRIVAAIRTEGVEPVACELLATNREHLAELGVDVLCPDFLGLTGVFDRIVANPPFSRGQDVMHVAHMWDLLRVGGRLVSIMSLGWTFRSDRRSTGFREFVNRHGGKWELLPADSFKASGTGVDAGILVLDKAA